MKYVILPLLFLVSSCSTIGQVTAYKPQEVKVIVPVMCSVKLPTKPLSELDSCSESDSILKKGNAAIIDRRNLDLYSKQLEAVISQCASESK